MGATISEASVQIRNLSTNISRSALSNREGFYRITQLPPNQYELSVTSQGFRKYVNREIVLQIGKVLSLDITLQAGVITEKVFVTSESSSLPSTISGVGQVISLGQIERLPINGRRFLDFALLTPHSSLSRDGRSSNNQIVDGGLSFGGIRSWMNNFMIDGVESNNLFNGAIINTISQDSVREFQVLTGNYRADVGRSAGAVVNIVTRSGANDFHGGIYDFIRNSVFDAHPRLARKGEDHFRQDQFGATVGGPFQRDRTFFFISYEGQRKAKQVGFSSAFIQNLESINRRKADFGLPGENPGVLPTDDYNEGLVRIDHNPNEKLSASFRFNTFREKTKFEFVGGSVLPSAGEDGLVDNQTLMGSLIAVLDSKWVNELRGGYSWRNRKKQSSSGFETGVKGMALQLTDVGSMGHLQTNIPMQREGQFEIADNLGYSGNKHYVKFGMAFSRVGSEAVLAYFDPPSFVTTLSGFLASPPRFSLIVAQEPRRAVGVNVNTLSAFFEDRWQILPNLTFDYGLRYDVEDVSASRWSLKSTTRPTVATPDKNNFQPRIGLSYSFSGGRTVVRSGFGIFNDKRVTQNELYELTFNPFIGSAIIFSPVGNLSETFLQYVSGATSLASQFGPLTGQGIDVNSFVNPYSMQWSLGVEHSIKNDFSIGAQYLGTRGVHLIAQAPGPKTNIAPWDGVTLASNGLPDYQFRRIDQRFSQYRVSASEGNSIYHGLSLTANKRYRNNFGINASYVFSKTIDDSTNLSGSTGPQDPYHRNWERALSNNDVRHRFLVDLTADAPVSSPRILRGLGAALIISVRSGRPFSYRAGTDLNHDFNNATDRVGLSGRNIFTGPAFASVDARISRLFNLSERLKLELIAEAFNLFNRFNIQDINDVYGRATFSQPPLSTFGTPNAAFDPREIQFAVRLKF
jgi:hypothetical protein